jgi:uncharacterized CHY-type Zn-finger protein
MLDIYGILVQGVELDEQTRCAHWRTANDIVAIRFPCCDTFYACYDCHAQLAGHPAQRWRKDQSGERAILCGGCGHVLTIAEYLSCGFKCPECGSAFNPGCQNHYHLYFEEA